MKSYKRLTSAERDNLAVWKAEGVTLREISRRLKRNISTISRELGRNSFKGEHYVAIHAQGKADERERIKAHLKQPLKNPEVYAYVTEKLKDGWSPDQIAGRLRKEHSSDPHFRICHETIYRWIYEEAQVKRADPYYEYL